LKKLAIFVEGQTEMIFVQRLIEEIAGIHKVLFQLETIGGRVPSPLISMTGTSQADSTARPSYFVLIFDCRQDERVKSVILDRYQNLEKASYSMIIGIRDLYPRSLSEMGAVKQSLRTRLPTRGIPIAIVLAVAEVEAWFIRDHSHFQRVDPCLNPDAIASAVGFDPRNGDVESIPHPSDFLHNIYRMAGKAYKKTRNHVQRTVDNLDYTFLYLQASADVPHLKELLTLIDDFLG
jgi:hypothetical protein